MDGVQMMVTAVLVLWLFVGLIFVARGIRLGVEDCRKRQMCSRKVKAVLCGIQAEADIPDGICYWYGIYVYETRNRRFMYTSSTGYSSECLIPRRKQLYNSRADIQRTCEPSIYETAGYTVIGMCLIAAALYYLRLLYF